MISSCPQVLDSLPDSILYYVCVAMSNEIFVDNSLVNINNLKCHSSYVIKRNYFCSEVNVF